ncbi:hypothetical protein LY78DRAFT_664558 [Colletotrichum sublineola]|nr:hypothetical protein LY78DRAFT_664558 [Colletotrichum sublineola]
MVLGVMVVVVVVVVVVITEGELKRVCDSSVSPSDQPAPHGMQVHSPVPTWLPHPRNALRSGRGDAPPAQLRKMTCPERRPGWAPSNPPLPVPLGFGGRKLVIGGGAQRRREEGRAVVSGRMDGRTYIYFVAIPERMYKLQDCWKYPEMYQMYQMYRSF